MQHFQLTEKTFLVIILPRPWNFPSSKCCVFHNPSENHQTSLSTFKKGSSHSSPAQFGYCLFSFFIDSPINVVVGWWAYFLQGTGGTSVNCLVLERCHTPFQTTLIHNDCQSALTTSHRPKYWNKLEISVPKYVG